MAKTAVLTSSGLIRTGGGKVYGVIVSSHSSGTLKLWDSVTANFDVLVDTFTYPSGSSVITFPGGAGDKAGVEFYTGLFATLTNAQSITIIWMPN